MEHSFIAWAKQRAARLPKVKLGIGDDCALFGQESLDSNQFDMVVTTDSLCDGTHFILTECGAHAAGRKLMAVNLSDLASMAATPTAVFLSLCLPKENAGNIAAEVFEGVYGLAAKYQVSIAGGDTNVWNGVYHTILWLESQATKKRFPIVQFSGDTDMATMGWESLTSTERPEIVVTQRTADEYRLKADDQGQNQHHWLSRYEDLYKNGYKQICLLLRRLFQ